MPVGAHIWKKSSRRGKKKEEFVKKQAIASSYKGHYMTRGKGAGQRKKKRRG